MPNATPATPASTWTLLKTFDCGLRLFARADDDALALADGSGETPSLTDDGVQIVDSTRSIEVIPDEWTGTSRLVAPVIAEDGSAGAVPLSVDTALQLLGLGVYHSLSDAGGVTYRVTTASPDAQRRTLEQARETFLGRNVEFGHTLTRPGTIGTVRLVEPMEDTYLLHVEVADTSLPIRMLPASSVRLVNLD